MPQGLELKCPECGRALVEVTNTARRTSIGPMLVFGIALALTGLAAAWFLTSRKTSAVPAQTEPASSSEQVILRLHGSNTIGEQLAPALAAAFFKAQGDRDVTIVRDSPETIRVVSGGKTISIEAHGSSTAFTDLAAGKCDIGMASRPVKPEESTSTTGDLTLPSAEHVVGLDGVAVIVNRNNSVDTLNKEQLAQIFAGAAADWSAFGGKPEPITIYARDSKSGTYDTFRSLVLGARPLAPSALRFEDSTLLAGKVAADPNGIGFVGLPYIGSTKVLAISDKGSRALTPNRLTVATEDYFLSRRLFLYNSANASSPAIDKFIEFAVSRAGQDVVEKIGFVSQHVRVDNTSTATAESPAEYKKIAASAERLTVDYRFKAGSSSLDNKAVVDLDRLVTTLSDLHYSGADLILLGFADATGDPATNQKLSKERATSVAEQIARRGVNPGTVIGFGQAMPIADNSTAEGRERNRRVEVWVKKKSS